jgi:tellurium resistance protein TerZ
MGIDLKKGQKISLEKDDGSKLNSFCVGANWGIIETSSFFSGVKRVSVDLDLSVGMFNKRNHLHNTVYFRNLVAKGIRHSGDDLIGDVHGDDGLDNEVMTINLEEIPAYIEQLVFVLNSYKKQDFATIPFASIRLYEGVPNQANQIFATYNIASDARFSGYVSMVLGKLYRNEHNEWIFYAIGEACEAKGLRETLEIVEKRFL